MGIIRFLAIALLVYYGFKLLVRFFLPALGKYAVKKATENMEEQIKKAQGGDKVYEQGNITIRKGDKQNHRASNSDKEEYIDYEEVK